MSKSTDTAMAEAIAAAVLAALSGHVPAAAPVVAPDTTAADEAAAAELAEAERRAAVATRRQSSVAIGSEYMNHQGEARRSVNYPLAMHEAVVSALQAAELAVYTPEAPAKAAKAATTATTPTARPTARTAAAKAPSSVAELAKLAKGGSVDAAKVGAAYGAYTAPIGRLPLRADGTRAQARTLRQWAVSNMATAVGVAPELRALGMRPAAA